MEYWADSFRKGDSSQDWQSDDIAKKYIEDRGYGEFFTHGLGHSIGYALRSAAVNLDGFETQDSRWIIPGIGFSIEPGIYLPKFGVLLEIDSYMSETGPYSTSPFQREVVQIRGD